MSRRRGNEIENKFCEEAEALGYCAYPARGSRGVIDVICFSIEGEEERLTPLAVQVGTDKKPIGRTLYDLSIVPRPLGSLCLVARYCKQKNGRRVWRFSTEGGTYPTLGQALADATSDY